MEKEGVGEREGEREQEKESEERGEGACVKERVRDSSLEDDGRRARETVWLCVNFFSSLESFLVEGART